MILFNLVSSGLFCQDNVWSLEKCITYALENNIMIKQQAINAVFQENTYRQSKFDAFPNLNANASHSYSFGRALDESTYRFTENENVQSNSFYTQANVTLFNGFQTLNTIKQNKLNMLASQKEVEKVRNDISLNIALAYLQILFNQELVTVAENQLEVTNQQVERTRILVNAGSIPHGNLLEIMAQQANEELQLVNYQNQLEISYLTLTQMLELDSVGDFRIEVPVITIPPGDELAYTVNGIYNHAELIMPQIQSAEYQLKASEAGLLVAKGMRSPNLSLNSYISTRYSDIRTRTMLDENGNPVIGPDLMPVQETYPFWDQLNDNINYGLGISLSIPIFNGLRTNTAVSNAKLNLDNSKLSLQNARNQLYKEIQQKYADARAALKRYNASQKTVTSMEESFRYVEQKLNVGAVTSVEYNTSKNMLMKAQSDFLQAKYEYIFQINVLEFYMGNPIKL